MQILVGLDISIGYATLEKQYQLIKISEAIHYKCLAISNIKRSRIYITLQDTANQICGTLVVDFKCIAKVS